MDKNYVLITPALNEEACIEKNIRAVVTQTILPKKWVIVNDGSTDNTGRIISEYASKHNFIDYLSLNKNHRGDFASKIYAFNAGYNRLKDIKYEFIGNLDADITFSQDYFEKILMKFKSNSKLGIAGGMVSELTNGIFRTPNYNVNSVAGAVQLFRRECYEMIGGYLPLKYGGVDAIAEVMSRMHKWEVRSFPDIQAMHHRRIGTSRESIIHSKLRCGMRDYSIGTHPLFMILKYIYRIRERPIIVGSLLMTIGYFWSCLRSAPLNIPEKVFKYARQEQMQRMLATLSRGFTKADAQAK